MRKLDILLIAASLVLIAWLLYSVDVGKVAATMATANPLLLVAAILVSLVGLSLRTLRWGVILREKHAVPWWDLYKIQCSGMAVSHFSPGKALEVVKVVPLKQFGVDYSFSLVSLVWERVFDMLVIFAFAFLAFPALDPNIRLVLSAIFAAVIAIAFLSFRHLEQLFKLVAKLPFLGMFSKLRAHNFRKRTLAISFAITALAWMADAVAGVMVFRSLGIDVPFMHMASAYMASVIVGIISFLPGGLGSTEAVMVLLLRDTGYAAAVLLSGVFLTRAFTLGLSAVVGFSLLPLVKKEPRAA